MVPSARVLQPSVPKGGATAVVPTLRELGAMARGGGDDEDDEDLDAFRRNQSQQAKPEAARKLATKERSKARKRKAAEQRATAGGAAGGKVAAPLGPSRSTPAKRSRSAALPAAWARSETGIPISRPGRNRSLTDTV